MFRASQSEEGKQKESFSQRKTEPLKSLTAVSTSTILKTDLRSCTQNNRNVHKHAAYFLCPL